MEDNIITIDEITIEDFDKIDLRVAKVHPPRG